MWGGRFVRPLNKLFGGRVFFLLRWAHQWIRAVMGKVRPFCGCGLEANPLRPYCGLLLTRFGYHGCNHSHFQTQLMQFDILCQGGINDCILWLENRHPLLLGWAVILFDREINLNFSSGDNNDKIIVYLERLINLHSREICLSVYIMKLLMN